MGEFKFEKFSRNNKEPQAVYIENGIEYIMIPPPVTEQLNRIEKKLDQLLAELTLDDGK